MLLPEEPEVLDSRDLTALNLSEKRAFGALSDHNNQAKLVLLGAGHCRERERANCTEVDLPMGTCRREPLDSTAMLERENRKRATGMQPLPAFFFPLASCFFH